MPQVSRNHVQAFIVARSDWTLLDITNLSPGYFARIEKPLAASYVSNAAKLTIFAHLREEDPLAAYDSGFAAIATLRPTFFVVSQCLAAIRRHEAKQRNKATKGADHA